MILLYSRWVTFHQKSGSKFSQKQQLIKEEILLRERSLSFVSATRAKKTLLITSYGERSSFIA